MSLLPASAVAFARRASSVSIVLGSKVKPWLTQTLKRMNQVERPLNSIPQHQRNLTETLPSLNATWTLTSIMLPKTTKADFKRDANNPFIEAIMNHKLVHIEGYIVQIDGVFRNGVVYKLTKSAIDTLIEHHKEVYCVDAVNTYDRPDGEQWRKELHEDFIQAINQFVFRTDVSALEGLEEDGTGELLNGRSNEVKEKILFLMKDPHQRALDVIQQTPWFSLWSQHGMPSSQPAIEPWISPSFKPKSLD